MKGYPHVKMPDHPNADRFGWVHEHVVVAARALGRGIPPGAEVHHIDGDKYNNAPSNLVLCESHEYHWLLHTRQRALDACGHADWLPCQYCKGYVDPQHLSAVRRTDPARQSQAAGPRYHRSCAREYQAARRVHA